MGQQVPMVDYLVLGDEPHLVVSECTACGARFFDRRNACASCGKTDFKAVKVPDRGRVEDVHHRRLCRAGHSGAVRRRCRRLRRHQRPEPTSSMSRPTPTMSGRA